MPVHMPSETRQESSVATTDDSIAAALSIALQAMSDAALIGLSVQRTQTVVDYLEITANNPLAQEGLRASCRRLAEFWHTIDLH